MTTRNATLQTLPLPYQRVGRCVVMLTLIASFSTVGCKWLGGGSGGGSGSGKADSSRGGDPLLGYRIPPQDVPLPERGGYAGRGRDPLLTSPAARDKNKGSEQAAKGDPNDVSALPPPRSTFGKEPYRPTLETTPAALAGGSMTTDDELALDRRAPAVQTRGTGLNGVTGPVPLTASIPNSSTKSNPNIGSLNKSNGFGQAFDDAAKYLKSIGAKWTGPVKENDQYAVRVSVPISVDQVAPLRQYQGLGATPAQAIQQVVELIRLDRAK